jgi:hypothetical protein
MHPWRCLDTRDVVAGSIAPHKVGSERESACGHETEKPMQLRCVRCQGCMDLAQTRREV